MKPADSYATENDANKNGQTVGVHQQSRIWAGGDYPDGQALIPRARGGGPSPESMRPLPSGSRGPLRGCRPITRPTAGSSGGNGAALMAEGEAQRQGLRVMQCEGEGESAARRRA